MKRMLQLIGCSALMLMAASTVAQENTNNRNGPPNFTGGTTPSTSENYALYNQGTVNLGSQQRVSTPILEVYPNPTATYTRVILDGVTSAVTTVSVVNMNGVLVRSYEYGAGSGRFDIDVSSLPDGIYALQVQERGKEAQSVQLLKNR